MSFKIVVLPSAKSDIQSASEWYETRQNSLGKKLKQEIATAIELIADPVRGHGTVYMGLSRAFTNKFPYCIYFKTDEVRQRIVIYAMLHEKQNRNSILEKRL